MTDLRFQPGSIEQLRIDELRPYARNPRTHSDDQVAKLAASLVEFGWTMSILVNDELEVIAGHGRILAARRLGLDAVPVIRLAHLSPEQVRAYRIADNKLALDAGWDEQLLAAEFHELNGAGYDLGLTGFSAEELDELLAPIGDGSDLVSDPDKVPKPPAQPASRPGDLWVLGAHRLLCGDSTSGADVKRLMHGERAVLFGTDPPYLVDYDGTNHPGKTKLEESAKNKDWSGTYWEACQANDEAKRSFKNTVLGETWFEPGEAPDWQRLYDRREDRRLGTVPMGGLLLTAGADVQKDRVEVSVWAWGRGLESWLVDHIIIDGSRTEPDTWSALSTLLGQVWRHQSGAYLTIARLAIDTGGQYTTEVYAWTRRQSAGHVMAIKGVDGFDRTTPVAGPTNIEARQGTKRSRGGAKLWTVAVAVFKSELYRFLRQDRPTDEDLDAGVAWPAGYVHLPKGLDAERIKQLVAEQLVTVKTKRGFDKLEWQKLRARNETLDCRVYARAAAWVAGIDRFTDGRWAQLEAQLRGHAGEDAERSLSPQAARRQAGASYRPVPHRRRVATSSWMTE